MDKGLITTIIGVAGFLTFLLTLLAFFGDYIDKDDFTIIAPSTIAFFSFLVSLFSKDSNKSHTQE